MPIVAKDGRVTIPKKVRDEVGFKIGDVVEVQMTALGIQVKKVSAAGKDRQRRPALSKRRMRR